MANQVTKKVIGGIAFGATLVLTVAGIVVKKLVDKKKQDKDILEVEPEDVVVVDDEQ